MRTDQVPLVLPNEPVLATSNGFYVKPNRQINPGRWDLTPTRLVFYQRSVLFLMFGLVGAVLASRSRGTLKANLELSRVESFARGRRALNTKVLDVRMSDGSVHRLLLDRFDEFTARLRTEISRQAVIAQVGKDSWHVQRVEVASPSAGPVAQRE